MDRFENTTAVIVEDDPFIAMDLQGILEDLGITVVKKCVSLKQALEAAHTYDADIFTLDYELGRETSNPVAEKLKSTNKQFIVISGKTERLLTRREFSGVPLISKPVDPTALIAAIKNVMAKH